MVVQAPPIYRYSLNEDDVITGVDHWWLAFAQENNAVSLTEKSVVGQAIWEFISDWPTRMLYKEIHERVRASGNPITIPFRCDSPTLQRHMQLTISKDDGGQILYESILVRAAPQRHLDILDQDKKRSIAFLTMCSFCKRSLIEPAGWLEMEDISLKLRLYDQQTVPSLRYTVCPECESHMLCTQ